MYPGYAFKCTKSKKWSTRLRVSNESMLLFTKKVQHAHETMPRHFRKKLEKSAVESSSEIAAAVHAIGQETMLEAPIEKSVIETQFYDKFVDGSASILVDIECALLEKKESFHVREISAIKEILDAHGMAAPVHNSLEEKTLQLDEDEYALTMKKAEYDIQCFEVWKKKYTLHAAAVYHKKNDFRMEQRELAIGHARKFMTGCIKLVCWDTPTKAIAEIQDFQKEIRSTKLSVSICRDNLLSLCFLNWSAPVSIASSLQEAQANVANWIVADNEKSAVLALMPVFAYKKNQVYISEKACIEALRKGNISVDMHWYLNFKDQVDTRDQRPMTYPGRLLLPGQVDPTKSAWKATPLFRMKRTDEVAQLPAQNMRFIEDMDPKALPPTGDDAAVLVQGARKYEQLGSDAWGAIMQSMLTGVDLPSAASGVLLVDLRVKTADLLRAFILKRGSFSFPLFYLGLCEDMTEFEWVHDDTLNWIATMIEEDQIVIPGARVQKDCPQDLLEAPPKPPTLNMLVMGGPNKDQLQMPASFLKKYMSNPVYLERFQKFVDMFHEKFGTALPNMGESSKDDTVLETPTKRRKLEGMDDLDHGLLIELSAVTGTKLHECNITGIKGYNLATARTIVTTTTTTTTTTSTTLTT